MVYSDPPQIPIYLKEHIDSFIYLADNNCFKGAQVPEQKSVEEVKEEPLLPPVPAPPPNLIATENVPKAPALPPVYTKPESSRISKKSNHYKLGGRRRRH